MIMSDSHEYIESLDDVKVGKNVLESLTRSAYDDCRCILREYVQNAADQIDIAKEEQLDDKADYGIYITIDKENRTIEIEDNATGVMEKEVLPILRNVACSQKKRGQRKGFRGIGRLGGLGYCSKLTFSTSYKGEKTRSTLEWNAAEMTRIIDDDADERSAGEVVSAVTKMSSGKEDEDKHYFKVLLDEVSDYRLLDVDDVRNYLSMVAPVDIQSAFSPHKNTIKRFMEENHLSLDTYNLYVNEEQVYKKYTTSILDKSGKKIDEVEKVECFIHQDSEGNPFYWGWYSICKLEGILDFKNVARGIRLRCKNIQLGDEGCCRRFLPGKQDQRFCDYFFGEIHVLSEKLIPDMDRNYLRVDDARTEFERMATGDFEKLKKMCYDASGYKSDYKKIKAAQEREEKFEKKKEKQAFGSEEELKKEQEEVEQSRVEAEKARKNLESRKRQMSDTPLAGVLENAYKLVPKDGNETVPPKGNASGNGKDEIEPRSCVCEEKTSFLRTDKEIYAKYDEGIKKVINSVYRVIGGVLSDEAMREALIARIEEELTKDESKSITVRAEL